MVPALSGELDFSSNSWETCLVVERKVPLQVVVLTSDLEFVGVSFQMSTLCMKCLIHVSGQAKVQSSRKCNKIKQAAYSFLLGSGSSFNSAADRFWSPVPTLTQASTRKSTTGTLSIWNTPHRKNFGMGISQCWPAEGHPVARIQGQPQSVPSYPNILKTGPGTQK